MINRGPSMQKYEKELIFGNILEQTKEKSGDDKEKYLEIDAELGKDFGEECSKNLMI